MFESIKILNFQKHRKRVIHFHEHVTTISGESESGKSTIIRAMRWVATNRPAGRSNIRKGASRSSVRLNADGRSVRRSKGEKAGNGYILDGKVFKAFGSGVPDEVSHLLNLGPINWQGQHDSAFWFSLSPGQVSKELNSIVNLSIIDKVLSKVAAKHRRAKIEVDLCRSRLQDATDARLELTWTVGCNEKLEQLETLFGNIQEGRARIASIASALDDVASLRGRLRKLSEASVCVLGAIRVGRRALEAGERIAELENLVGSIESGERISSMELPGMWGLDKIMADLEKRDKIIKEMRQTVDQVNEITRLICEKERLATELEGKIEQETEGKCPVCGKPMTSLL